MSIKSKMCLYILAYVIAIISAAHVAVQRNLLSLVKMTVNLFGIKYCPYFQVCVNYVGLILLESSNEKTFRTDLRTEMS